MIPRILRTRSLVAAIAFAAAVGTAGVSALAAPAYAQEEQQEQQTQEQLERQAQLEAKEKQLQAKEKLEVAQREARAAADEYRAAMGMARGQLHEHLALAQESLERAQEMRIRGELARVQARAPRVQIRAGGPAGLLRTMRGRGSVERVLAHSEELGLTEQQEASIRSAQRDQRRARIARDASIEVAELDLEELMEDITAADLIAVEAKMTEISGLRVQERMAELRLQRQVHGVLSDEQREQLDAMAPNVMMWRSGDGEGSSFFFEPGEGENAFFFGDGEAPHLFDFEDFEGEFEIQGLLEGLKELEPFRFLLERRHNEEEQEAESGKESTEGVVIG